MHLHWDAVEADFQRFYHSDLRYELGRAGCRRIHALVKALPADAMLWRIQEPESEPEKPKTIRAKSAKDIRDFLRQADIG